MLYGGMGGIEQQVTGRSGDVGLQFAPGQVVAPPVIIPPIVSLPKRVLGYNTPATAAPKVVAPQYGGMGGISQVIQRQITIPAKTITIKTPQSAALFPSGFTAVPKSTTVTHNFTQARFNAIPAAQLSNPVRQKTLNNLQLIIAKLQKSLGLGG